MPAPETELTVEQRLLVPRVVVGSMLGGLLAFAVVVWLMFDRAEAEPGDSLLVVAAGLIFLAGVALAWAFGRFQVDRSRRRGLKSDVELTRAFFETVVIRAAALELAGFVWLIAFMTSGRIVALAGAGAAALLMVALFPTRDGFESFRRGVTGGGGSGDFEPR